MRQLVFILLLLIAPKGFSQIHNRLVKLNLGYTTAQLGYQDDIKNYNDTSKHHFELVTQLPSLSYTHEFIISDILSISGKGGFQYMNIFFDNTYYGGPLFYVSVNPALSIFYRNKFEYYIKLQACVNYWLTKSEVLDDVSQRIFPEKFTIFTGVTIAGFNYYFSPKFRANLELSIWTPELISVGLSYRFFKGELPSIQEMQEL